MTTDYLIAWMGKWQYFHQDDESAAHLEEIAKRLKVFQKLEEQGLSVDREDIVKACELYGKSVKKHERYQEFVDAYFSWHKATQSVEPRLGAAQGKAMNEIITYLVKQSKGKDEEGALLAWQYILGNWKKLTLFIQNQTKLTQINKNLQEILTQLRNGTTKTAQKELANQNAAARIRARRRKG